MLTALHKAEYSFSPLSGIPSCPFHSDQNINRVCACAIREVENAQDLQCLAQMASTMGTKKDKQEIRKLIDFLEKYSSDELTVEDVRNLDINLSVGGLKCKSFNEE